MNNEERDKKIEETHRAVIAMEQIAHNPMECAAMRIHQESHGRHVRWFFWTIAAVVGVGGLLAKIFMP